MRLIAILLALLIPTAPWASAPNAKIKTLFVQGKPAYVVVFSNLTNEHDAQSQQKQLQSQVEPNSVQLITEPNHTFSIKAGPLTDYELAKRLVQNTPVPTETTPAQLPSSNSPDAPTPDAPTDEKLWNLSNADIRAVIAEVSRATGKNFVIDPRVQGKISIVSTTPLNNQALYQVFLSVLQISGYSAIPGDGIIKIVPNMDAKTLSDTENPRLKIPPRGEEILTSVIPVHYVPADQLVPVLRPLMPQWSFISAYTPANMLILSGTANNIRQISEIIHQVDSSSSHDIDVVQLHHALAMDVVNTLKELVKSTTTSAASQSTPTLAVDDRNNSILISGSRTARLRLRMIIAKLDKPISSSTSNHTQVIYLHYLRAEDLTPILAGVAQANFSGTVGTTIGTMTQPTLDSTNPLSSIVGDNPYSAPSQQKPAPQPSTPAVTNSSATPNTSNASGQTEGSTKPNVQIIAEPNTNSIIINGPASIIRIMKSVVSQLDIRPAQLLIEAMVAEIDETNLINLGIEWGSLGQTGKVDGFRPGFAIINSKTSINDFQAQINALQRDSKANILSTPSVVVLDNRQAKILIGKQVSVASTSYPNNGNGTTVSTSPYTTFNRVNVALHLYVRPQITQSSGIQLQIDQGNDTIDPTATAVSGQDTPTFKISSIVTSVHVQSGDIVVLGGLTEDSLGNDDISIPILRDIPGIGRMFQKNLRNREKRVLMVFIRPIILHNPADSLHVTGEKYNSTRDFERALVRSQEMFVQSDDQTILKPLRQAQLPVPFTSAPAQRQPSSLSK